MTAVEIIIWSLALGAIGAVVLGRLVDFAIHPSRSALHSTAFHITVFALVAIMSGLLDVLEPFSDAGVLEAAQVMAGPLCVGLSAFWVGGWLNARHRERLMAGSLCCDRMSRRMRCGDQALERLKALLAQPRQ